MSVRGKGRGALEGGRFTAAATCVVVALSLARLAASGLDEPGLRAVVRLTARASLGLFLAAFVASSLVAVRPSPASKWLLRNRRHVGLSLAASQAVHAVAIVLLLVKIPTAFGRIAVTTIAGGLVGYAFLAAMTVTSFDAPARWLGRARWRALHRAGMYWLWVVFTFTYAPRAASSATGAVFTAALVAAFGARIVVARRRARRATSPGAGGGKSSPPARALGISAAGLDPGAPTSEERLR